jgi:hypothetical protein
LVAALAARPAVLRAVCWRPRALPPALAVRVREALLRVPEPDALDAVDARLGVLREDELPPEPDALLRDDAALREDELREPDPLDDEREPDEREPDERELVERDDPPLPDPPLRDPPPAEPPLELRFDSAIS